MVGRMDEGMSHLILLAVPLFIFLGALIEMTGMARGHDPVPRQPAGPCARRPVLCAGRRDVPGVRHLRLQGGRHGGDRAGAVPRDEEARRQARRAGRAAVGHRRADRDHSAQHRADHHRLGHRRLDRARCSPAGCCRRVVLGARAVRRRLVALSQRGPAAHVARAAQARDRHSCC